MQEVKIYDETSLSADDLGDWYAIDPDGRNPKSRIAIQGYFANVAGTLDATVKIDYTIDKTLADSDNLFETSDAENIDAVAGGVTFHFDNYGFRFIRVRYTANNCTNSDLVVYAGVKTS